MGPDGPVAPSSAPAAGRPARGAISPPQPSAPKKGLQVQLPDDDVPPPPPVKAKPIAAPPAAGKKGRRGAWWDEEKGAADEEPPPPPPADEPKDDAGEHDGATAFVRLGEIPEEEPPKDESGEHDGATAFVSAKDLEKAQAEPVVVEARPRRKQEQPEVYKPVPAPDYQGHIAVGESALRKWARRVIVLGTASAVLGIAALVGLYFYLSQSLPRIESIADYKPLVATHVVSRDGALVGQFYKERRTVVPIDKVPRHLLDAVVSAEDKDFYKHHGVSVIGLARAAIVDILSGKKRLGASTITQQVVKTFFLSGEKKFSRKVKEILLAFKIEKDLSKDDILALYLNQINFGAAHYGVEEAARYYFGKHVAEVNLGEAAILAGLPQNPGRLNPRFHPASAKRRQTYVLDRMLANKKIDKEQRDREVGRPISLPPPAPELVGGWYLQEVKKRLVEQYGEAAVNTAGMTVEVAMDAGLQRAAESALREGLRAVDKRQGWRGGEFNLGESIEEVRTSLARRYAAMAPAPNTVMVFDLGGIPESEQQTADKVARAARVKPLVAGGRYAGIVVKVEARGFDVELAPDIIGWVPMDALKWARPFKPGAFTPAPKSPREVVKRGDIVQVSATKVVLKRTSAVALRGRELELALEQTPSVQGAFAAIDLRTRNLVALVGGYDVALSQFNRATQAKRQPGSAFKPILYAAAIETGKYTPATRVDDSPEVVTDPYTGKQWKPQNFEKDQYDGPMPLRKALAASKNTVAVKLLHDVGLDRVRAVARLVGLSTELPKSDTTALGTGEVIPLELVNAYATIGSLGRKAEPILIRKVRSRDGTVMFTAETAIEPALKPEVAYVTADMMRAVIEDPEGTARSLAVLQRPIAGKTGTASEHRDAWFVGFTPSLVAGAWVGFDNHDRLGPLETGGHAAGPIWLRFMKAATANTPIEDWPAPPPGVTVAKVNRNTGALSTDPNDPYAQKEVFLAGTEPVQAAATADQTQFLKE